MNESKEVVVFEGKEVFAGSYWPESPASCEAHERAMLAAMRRARMTEKEIDEYFLAQWNES